MAWILCLLLLLLNVLGETEVSAGGFGCCTLCNSSSCFVPLNFLRDAEGFSSGVNPVNLAFCF